MYSIYADDICIYSDTSLLDDMKVVDPKLSMEDNAAGSLTMTIPPTNRGYSTITRMATDISVYKEGTEIWSGRVLDESIDFWNNRVLVCEGALAFLNDTSQPPAEYHNETVTSLLTTWISIHNAKVAENRQFTIGEVTVIDSNDSLYRYTNYESTLECINDKLIDSLGGHLRVRKENGVRYLDYLADYPNSNTQTIEFGKNLLDFTREWDMTDFATVVVPQGNALEESDIEALTAYLTVESVNNGSIYVVSEDAVAAYGWIEKVVSWDDVSTASALLTKAKTYLSDIQFDNVSIEMNAIDLHYLNVDYEDLKLLDQVRVISSPHGMDRYFPIKKLEIPLAEPENSTVTLGEDSATYTKSASTSVRQIKSSVDETYTYITKLVSDYVKVEYLEANYVDTATLEATYATIEKLESDYITAETIKSTYATIATLQTDYLTADNISSTYATIATLEADYLTAAQIQAAYTSTTVLEATYATITNLMAVDATVNTLSADLANVTTILSGVVGTGSLATIRLTASNVVIDDAVINDAAIASLSASKLTAGTIYTSQIKIQSAKDDESLYISGSLMQFSDDSIVRMQLGKDADGEFNIYICDPNGSVIWDALGLTEAGLTGNGAIIKDAAVANDAAISGSKLDIRSVAKYLNEDGSITVDYSKIIVNDTTLNYTLTTITDNIEAATAAAKEAQAAADTAQADATQAASAATAAQKTADDAQAVADAAKEAAANAQTYAEEAQRDAASALSDYAASVTTTLDSLQSQIDGQIETWYYDYAPSLTNLPASDWATDEEKEAHVGDLFFDKSTGYSYRFFSNDGTYEWILIQDTDIATALSVASTAQDTADAKKRVFTSTPVPPYDIGDLWTDGTDIKTCMTARVAGATYVSSDWVVLNEYANQDTVDAAQAAADNAQAAADAAQSTADDAATAAKDAQAAADNAQAAADAVTSRVTTLETDLTVVQGQITAKVWKTDIESAIGDITVGGRNLVADSDEEKSCVKDYIKYYLTDYGKAVIPGRTIVISYEAKTDTEGNVCDQYIRTDSASNSTGLGAEKYTKTLTTDWERYSQVVEVNDNEDSVMVCIRSNNAVYGCDTTIQASATLYVRNVKAELGNVATDWTAAPEDTEEALTAINENYAELVLTIDGITSDVGTINTILVGDDDTTGLADLVNDNATTIDDLVAALSDSDGNYISVESLQSQIEQLPDEVAITISSSLASYEATQEGILTTLDEYATYFSFTTDGLRISDSDSDFALLLSSDRVSFLESDSEVAYISDSMLYIYDADILNSLQLGNFKWMPRESGNLSLVKVGDS